jgi:hypothetical protein
MQALSGFYKNISRASSNKTEATMRSISPTALERHKRTSSCHDEKYDAQSPGVDRTSFRQLFLPRWVGRFLSRASCVRELCVLLPNVEFGGLKYLEHLYRDILEERANHCDSSC